MLAWTSGSLPGYYKHTLFRESDLMIEIRWGSRALYAPTAVSRIDAPSQSERSLFAFL